MQHVQTWVNMALLVSLLTGLTACGGSSDSDSDSNNADRHRIFVTSTTYTGNLGGVVGADIVCTNVATGAGIPGSYKAVLSSSTEDAFTSRS